MAHWVFEHLTAESTRRAENVDRQKSAFEEDKSLHPYFRSTNSDYKYSGFDRFGIMKEFVKIVTCVIMPGGTWRRREITWRTSGSWTTPST